MAESICIKCGSEKTAPWRKCRSCAFQPVEGSAELAKSVYLSLGRYEEGEERREYAIQLNALADTIRSGKALEYDETELLRLQRQEKVVRAIGHGDIGRALFRVLLPGLLFLLVLVGVLILLRALK